MFQKISEAKKKYIMVLQIVPKVHGQCFNEISFALW
jgi:hypothetical protein